MTATSIHFPSRALPLRALMAIILIALSINIIISDSKYFAHWKDESKTKFMNQVVPTKTYLRYETDLESLYKDIHDRVDEVIVKAGELAASHPQGSVVDTIKKSPNVMLSVESKRILYIVRSFPGKYERLSLQSLTWMTHLDPDNEAIYVASQFTSDEWEKRKYVHLPEVVKTTFATPICTENNHGMGLCCQEANAFLDAATMEEFQVYDWFFFIDDDLFASPSVIRQIVLDYNESSLVSIGTPGCASESYSGFCGGGGYLVSRVALKKTVALPNFASEYMKICNVTQYCDIVTAWMLENQANASIVHDGRFHPWGIQNVAEILNKSYDNDTWGVTHSLIHTRQKYIGQLRRGHNSKSQVIPHTIPTKDMFDYLRKYPQILQAVASRKYATLHYYGGELTDAYSTASQKVAFLNLIYDVALDNPFADSR
jgi:hypothetical protein